MEKILICPSERRQVAFLAQTVPLVAIPVLGEPLISHWLEALATRGVKEAVVLATDRPELVRAVVGDGSRWGVRVQVRAELKEPTPAEAAAQFGAPEGDSDRFIVVDHLPGQEDGPHFRSYRDWFGAVLAWIPRAAKLNRIGLHEIQPQVWCGRRTVITPGAKLHGPCWLGDHVRVGADAVIGPNAVLENGVVVDSASEIRSSMIGPDTFVGALTKVEDSIAWGNTLIDWRTGSCTEVPDSFLLCALGQRYVPEGPRSAAGGIRSSLSQLLGRPWAFMMALPGRLRR